MLDAIGKPEPNVLGGGLKWLGAYDECKSAEPRLVTANGTITPFQPHYCMVWVRPVPKVELTVRNFNLLLILIFISLCPFDISAGVGAFVIGLCPISFFFSICLAKDQWWGLISRNTHMVQHRLHQNDLKTLIKHFRKVTGTFPRKKDTLFKHYRKRFL